jgi:hypothetical protein
MAHSSALYHCLSSGSRCDLTSVWHTWAKLIDYECQQSYFAMVAPLCLLSNPLLSQIIYAVSNYNLFFNTLLD